MIDPSLAAAATNQVTTPGLAAFSIGSIAETLIALVAVLAAIVLAGRIARARGFALGNTTHGALRLRGTLALDPRRRLHIVDIGNTSVLVLTGGAQDQMLPIAPPPPAPVQPLTRTAPA